ncbi:MAG: hypothetical protein C4334_10055 [Pyrinomonas sp.]
MIKRLVFILRAPQVRPPKTRAVIQNSGPLPMRSSERSPETVHKLAQSPSRRKTRRLAMFAAAFCLSRAESERQSNDHLRRALGDRSRLRAEVDRSLSRNK